jgi:hypothetical protein
MAICDDTTHAVHAALHVDSGKNIEYQALLKSSDGHIWECSCTKEIAHLAQRFPASGIPASKGTNTLFFIPITAMPAGRKATYLRLIISDQPQKAQPHHVRFTIGGDHIDYPGEVSTKKASLATANLLFNSVISSPGAKFMTMDIKDFYLCTLTDHFEYMWIKVADIPKDIFKHYNLGPLIHKGYFYTEI